MTSPGHMPPSFLDHPVHVDGRGRLAETGEADHIRDLIFQVLFTSPGERVNRPDFGCGLKRLLFMPNSDALAAATQVMVRGALERWLDMVIRVERVDVAAEGERLVVTIVYVVRVTGERRVDRFSTAGAP